MTIDKLPYPAKQNETVQKINEIIDNIGSIDGGTAIVDTEIQLRHDDEDNWETVNPTLEDGEVGLAYVDDYQSVGIPNYTIEGSPVINNDYVYIASGSESSPKNYVFVNKILQFGSYTWKIIAKLNSLESNRTIGAPIFAYNGGSSGDRYDIPYLAFESTSHNRLTLSLSHSGNSWAYDAAGSHEYTGTEYVKLEFDGTKYTVEYSSDGETWNLDNTYTSSSPIYQTAKDYLGIGSYNPDGTQRVYKGELDLKEFKVYINNVLEWEGVTFTSEPVRGTKLKIGDGSTAWNSLDYWVQDTYNATSIYPISGLGVANALASSGFMTEVTSTDVTTALGYTPYNGSTNPNGYISSASMSALTDVTLTSLADGQIISYNSTTQKWENTTPSGSSVLEVINITVGLNTSTFVPETFTWSIQNPYGTISALNANGKVAYAFAEVMFGQVKVNDTYMLQVVNGSSLNDSLIFQCMIGSDEIGIVTLNSSNVTTMAIYNLGDFVSSLSDLGIIATATELNYVNGVTSNIQTQLDSKKVTFRDWS